MLHHTIAILLFYPSLLSLSYDNDDPNHFAAASVVAAEDEAGMASTTSTTSTTTRRHSDDGEDRSLLLRHHHQSLDGGVVAGSSVAAEQRQLRRRNRPIRQKQNGDDDREWVHQKKQQRRQSAQKDEVEDQESLSSSSSSCVSLGWHPDLANKDGCTDDENIDESWLDPGRMQFYLFKTAEECCNEYPFPDGRDCRVRESGCRHDDVLPDSLPDDTTPTLSSEPPLPCRSFGWHPDMIYKDGCSDDDNIEESWKFPTKHGVFMFDTAEKCCEEMLPGQECQIYESECVYQDPNDVAMALGSGCEEDLPWHPNFETKVGCSNSNEESNMPEGWTQFYDSPTECCEHFHDNLGNCPVIDVCSEIANDVVYLLGPTKPPTMRPTQAPTSVAQWQKLYYNTPNDDPPAGDIDFWLLSGQSNAVGHTMSGFSIGGNADYWTKVRTILGDAGKEAEEDAALSKMEEDLYSAIYDVNFKYLGAERVATHLTNGTMELHREGLLYDLDTPLTLASCSFVVPQDHDEINDRSGGVKSTAWNAGCGGGFGHELMFSRTVEIQMGQQNNFEVVKSAHDGTTLYKYWYPNHGRYWDKLTSSIRSRKGYGNWKGFIWHQGVNDAVPGRGDDTSLTYLGNLTGLVDAVRGEMFDASEAGFWQCKDEIPVVVVQIGYWPESARGQRVREAQAQYCDGDARAELVHMDDLSRYYHFDAPSFLISGNRIAHAYQAALQASMSCPDSAPPPLTTSAISKPAINTSSSSTPSPLEAPTASSISLIPTRSPLSLLNTATVENPPSTATQSSSLMSSWEDQT